jgi:hypothetical protein
MSTGTLTTPSGQVFKLTDVKITFGPCQHRWSYAPTCGYFSCMDCRELVNYDDDRFEALLLSQDLSR